jgi:hypothetical protein
MAAAEHHPTENTPLLREEIRTITPEQVSDNSSLPQENGAQKVSSSTSPQLRYILPAISIGVSHSPLATQTQYINSRLGFPSSSRPNHHRSKLRKNWQRLEGPQLDELDCHFIFPDFDFVSALVWQTVQHFWAQGMFTICLYCLWDGKSVLWDGAGYQSAYCCEGMIRSDL